MATATSKKKSKKAAPEVGVTIAAFDSARPFRILEQSPLKGFRTINPGEYQPSALTPLRDATMRMIEHLDALRSTKTVQVGLLLDESGSMRGNEASVVGGVNEFIDGMRDVDASEPNRVLCVIFTDGLENASHDTTPEQLHEAVSKREADGWTFIFMGANMDVWDEGRSQLGVSGGLRGQTVAYTSSSVGTQSAMTHATRRAGAFVQGEEDYAVLAASMGNASVIPEEGEAVPDPVASPSIPKPGGPKKPKPKPPKKPKPSYESVGDAIKKARESL